MPSKPFWKQGDVLALTNELCRGSGSVHNGCHVFEAEKEPVFRNGTWCYGFRPQSEFRHATDQDIDRLIGLELDKIRQTTERATNEIIRLWRLRLQVKRSTNG